MTEMIFLGVLAFAWILVAVIQDLKTREIANWINFSLIVFAMGSRFFFSLFSNDFSLFFQGIIGLGVFFALGNLLYYGRMFAGGDAKLMIALGAVLPASADFVGNLRIFAAFLITFLFVGAFYGLVTGIFFSIKNFRKFRKEFSKQFRSGKKMMIVMLSAGLILTALGFLNGMFFALGMITFVFPYLYVYAKSVEESCMIRKTKTEKLREGDWLYEDVKIKGKTIKTGWEGLSKENVKFLKENEKNVLIREGIPFAPVFLISFLIVACVYVFKPEYLKILF